MTAGPEQRSRIVFSIAEAAEALSISRDSFERHVMPALRLVRVGRRLLVPVAEIEHWVELNSAIPLLADLSPASADESTATRREHR